MSDGLFVSFITTCVASVCGEAGEADFYAEVAWMESIAQGTLAKLDRKLLEFNNFSRMPGPCAFLASSEFQSADLLKPLRNKAARL
jgi:hypothetical protein